ncbi:MAG: cytochrome P450 [Pseudomonadota bacterium]
MTKSQKLERIPMPDRKPIVGNMLSVDANAPLQSMMEMTRELGPIIRMDMMGKPILIVSGFDLVDELSDEKRFDKTVRGSLRRVRAIGGDGLFTGDTDEPNWPIAHRILMPPFSQSAMGNYFDMMLDIASELCLKWERLNPEDDIDVVRDMTALTLDTIGLCGFNYRFNSFYRQDYHPFINALGSTMETCMKQRGLPFEDKIMRKALDQMKDDVDFMYNLVDTIIAERREGGGNTAVNDLLNYMLAGVDKVTGQSLSDENIRFQINTFLIAGHETTSGLLSFTHYFLLQNPDVLEKAYAEVDRVLGRDIAVMPTHKQVNSLSYCQQILFEALRLWPTVPLYSVSPFKDEILGGKYKIKKGTFTSVLLPMLHRDPSVWGEAAEVFNPDNFTKDAIAARPVNAYKPFGNGQRACLGRQFAIQEATLILGMILQRFELIDHTNYKLKIKESLSIKPDNFKIKVRLRPDVTRGKLVAAGEAEHETDHDAAEEASVPAHGTKALVLYGSNLGSTEEYARNLARAAKRNGFDAELAELDAYAGALPTEGAVLIACASYNGTPPDNAVKFTSWLESAEAGSGKDVHYAIFGCGHSDWAATFQATPRTIDTELARIGATRITEKAEGDAREGLDEPFEAWSSGLWTQISDKLGLDLDLSAAGHEKPLYEVSPLAESDANPLADQMGAEPLAVLANSELQNVKASGRSTRHIDVQLAEGQSYLTGDHLSVAPINSDALIGRVLTRFGFDWEDRVKIASEDAEHSTLPVDKPVSLRRLLGQMVELQSVASRKDVERLVRYTECPKSKPALEKLAGDDFKDEVQRKHRSVLDLLENFPACTLPFGVFLELCPMLAPRYYSISSSSAVTPETCSITVGVVDEPAISGEGHFKGVCSNYLADIASGQKVQASIRKASDDFRLPEDPATPIIMVGPGTGIAPFRGFLQERAQQKADGKTLGEGMLFFGCRHPDEDYIYADELENHEDEGVIDLYVAFSRRRKKKIYVQDLIREERDAVWDLLEKGAKVFVCGDGSRMEPDVRRALTTIYAEEKDVSAEAAEAWMDQMVSEARYVLDVWAS